MFQTAYLLALSYIISDNTFSIFVNEFVYFRKKVGLIVGLICLPLGGKILLNKSVGYLGVFLPG